MNQKAKIYYQFETILDAAAGATSQFQVDRRQRFLELKVSPELAFSVT